MPKYNLICKIPVAPYVRGAMVTDQVEVLRLMKSHDPHFVKVLAAEDPGSAPSEPEPDIDPPHEVAPLTPPGA